MNKNNVEQFAFLWESDRYILLRRNGQDALIVDRVTGSTVLIEDDETYELVLEKMSREGVPLMKEIPESARSYQQTMLDLIDTGTPASVVNRIAKEMSKDRRKD